MQTHYSPPQCKSCQGEATGKHSTLALSLSLSPLQVSASMTTLQVRSGVSRRSCHLSPYHPRSSCPPTSPPPHLHVLLSQLYVRLYLHGSSRSH
ncbi:hypothetical protein E2C01_075560 [Portunus trituberculatus]|uniref:Uncharacterized protein n=1 Tax=Portunus trituberculatus TaxID=210409 RepID=A0A5B7I6E6_PORTR|nr:hypothetical protein [Portunus trituberculatus]